MTISINPDRFLGLIRDFARFGALPGGGITRRALSAEDIAGREFLSDYARKHGLTVWLDPAANLHFSIASEQECTEGTVVMTGSHIDSVPQGGHLDGALGVLTGIESLLAIQDAGAKVGMPIEVVAFTDEEGRFGGMVGSQAMTGQLDLSTVADLVDDAGFSLKDAMRDVGLDVSGVGGARRDLSRIRGFVELHIEQGPVLEAAKTQIGVVTGIAGLRKLRCRFLGLAGHAGTNPMNLRRDALAGMTHLHARLPELTHGDAVATIGRVDVSPNAPNVIPGEVTFTIDLRTTDLDALKTLRAAIVDSGADIAAALNLTFEYEQLSHFEPLTCTPRVVAIIESLADQFGYTHLRMPSGAAHDTMNFRSVDCKGMIFVPSIEGISHNVLEETDDKDLIAGGNVLTNTLAELTH